MHPGRIARIRALLLLGALGCTDGTGITADGPTFLTATDNGRLWTLTSPTLDLQQGSLMISGLHSVPDSNLMYTFELLLQSFPGTGTYPVGTGGEVYAGIVVYSNFLPTYTYIVNLSVPPGTLTITEYRASDSTLIGSYNVHLARPGLPGVTADVKGNFRLRPTY